MDNWCIYNDDVAGRIGDDAASDRNFARKTLMDQQEQYGGKRIMNEYDNHELTAMMLRLLTDS